MIAPIRIAAKCTMCNNLRRVVQHVSAAAPCPYCWGDTLMIVVEKKRTPGTMSSCHEEDDGRDKQHIFAALTHEMKGLLKSGVGGGGDSFLSRAYLPAKI
jgi:inosine/xanthosine triphosphate pyrophosphatase family protein